MRATTRTLWLHCLRHDVVESAGRGSSTLLSGVLFSFLVAALVAGSVRGEPVTVAAPLEFALLGVFALVDAFGDVAAAFLDPRDLPLLRVQPVAPRDYARARLLALALPVAVKTAALAAPPLCAAAVDGASGRELAAFVLAFAAMELCFASGAIGLLLLVRRLVPRVRLSETVAWTRSLLLVATTGGALVAMQSASSSDASHSLERALAHPAIPSAWFAQLFVALAGRGAAGVRVAAAIAATGAALLATSLLARNYVRLLEGVESLAAAPPRRSARPVSPRRLFERLFVASSERPSFRLALALLRRERTFRLQTLPLLAYPLLFLWLGRGRDDGGLFALLFAQFPAAVIVLATTFLRFTDSPAGGFTLAFHGAARGRSLESGARKALWYAVVLPLSVVVALLLAWDRGPTFGLAAGAVGLAASTVAALAARPREPELPFVERLQGTKHALDGGRAMALLFGVVAAGVVEWRLVAAGVAARVALSAAALAATVGLVRRVAAERPAARLDAAAYEPAEVATSGTSPFPIRLRRELQGLALFFGVACAVLTVFFAWI